MWEYYPCRLSAVLSFAYVRQTHTAAIVELMEAAANADGPEVLMFRADGAGHEVTSQALRTR